VQWHTYTAGPVAGSPALADGTAYAGSSDNTVYGLHTTDGTPESMFTVGLGWRQSSPTIANQTMYIGSQDSALYAVHTS